VINALNSGADVFMADFEDALAPTWERVIGGQEVLFAAVRRTLRHESPDGKQYTLVDDPAVLFVRPRGWHLDEAHVWVDGHPMSASLFDFGLFCFQNASELLACGSGPYFYLPKLQGHLEARLWNDVFAHAESTIGLPHASIKATVLLETLPAAFEMDELLYELRQRSAGLNCGRWDYLFSFLKEQPHALLPDRAQLTMDQGFLRAFSLLLIRTCHRRGAHAMGGMAAQIPIKGDPVANDAALARVRADKEREARDGHDGTWVAHPGLVGVAREVFAARVPGENQLHVLRDDVVVTREDLLRIPAGTRTEEGLRHNVSVGVRYLESWLRGEGCVPLFHLMEDAATAEICRAQVWQQVRYGLVTRDHLDRVLREVLADTAPGRFDEARALFRQLSTAEALAPFLTTPAYQHLLASESDSPPPESP
jgi:malate synthase